MFQSNVYSYLFLFFFYSKRGLENEKLTTFYIRLISESTKKSLELCFSHKHKKVSASFKPQVPSRTSTSKHVSASTSANRQASSLNSVKKSKNTSTSSGKHQGTQNKSNATIKNISISSSKKKDSSNNSTNKPKKASTSSTEGKGSLNNSLQKTKKASTSPAKGKSSSDNSTSCLKKASTSSAKGESSLNNSTNKAKKASTSFVKGKSSLNNSTNKAKKASTSSAKEKGASDNFINKLKNASTSLEKPKDYSSKLSSPSNTSKSLEPFPKKNLMSNIKVHKSQQDEKTSKLKLHNPFIAHIKLNVTEGESDATKSSDGENKFFLKDSVMTQKPQPGKLKCPASKIGANNLSLTHSKPLIFKAGSSFSMPSLSKSETKPKLKDCELSLVKKAVDLKCAKFSDQNKPLEIDATKTSSSCEKSNKISETKITSLPSFESYNFNINEKIETVHNRQKPTDAEKSISLQKVLIVSIPKLSNKDFITLMAQGTLPATNKNECQINDESNIRNSNDSNVSSNLTR